MRKIILLFCLVFCFSIVTNAQEKKEATSDKVVNVPPDYQQSFQASQSEVEKAEANLKAAQAALDAAKARREALVFLIMLKLKLPAEAQPQLNKGLLQFMLPPEEKPEKKPN